VTERPDEADDLRRAFQELDEAAPADGVDLERVWGAVSGESPAEERRAVVEKVAVDPSWALAWRAADALWTASRELPVAVRTVPRWSNRVGLRALAAGLLLVAVGMGFWIRRSPTPPVHRQGATARVESLVPEGRPLPRADVVLRWTGPPGATYDVRITSEDLRQVHTATELEQSEYRPPAEFFASLPAAATLLWQVEAHLPDRRRVRSETFVMKLE
jgi:hypothetical protein